jgi:uncharacterized membrane protein
VFNGIDDNEQRNAQAEPEGERETGRLEAFSDGVFAIAITLLILTIQVPSLQVNRGHLYAALKEQWPSYAAYLISFVFILVMWVNHHNLFRLIRRTDHTFLLLNGLLLLFVTFVPFPTALLAEYIRSTSPNDRAVALAVFNGTYILLAVAFNLLWRYASYHRRLLGKRADPLLVQEVNRRFGFGWLYLACFLIGLVIFLDPLNIAASLILNVALAAFYALPSRAQLALQQQAQPPEGMGDMGGTEGMH